MLKRIEDKIFNASEKLNYISGVALTLMMGLIFINVLSRLVWRPITGTYDYVGMLASVTISFALARCAAMKGHVAISLFTERLSTRAQGICEAIVGAIGTVLFTVMFWQSIRYALVVQRSGEVSFTTATPIHPLIYGMAFGFLMLALVSVIDFLNSFKKVAKR